MGISKQRKRHGGISDAEEQSHRLFHLYQSDFPGLSFEFKILQPGECEGDLCVSAKTIIDHRGKIRLDQNDGTPVPLDQIPDVLAGKDADMTDGLHLPNTVAALLTDHNKTLHDTLGIDADMVDGYHHDQSLLTTASPQFANLQCAGTGHDGFSDFVANEHIDWTNASANLLTTGYMDVENYISLSGDPNKGLYLGGTPADNHAGFYRTAGNVINLNAWWRNLLISTIGGGDIEINPASGIAYVTGSFKATNYYSGDGTQGWTGTFDIANGDSVTVKDGLITDVSPVG